MATPTPATVEEFLAYLDKSIDPGKQDLLEGFLEAGTEAAEGWAPKGRLAVGPIVVREFDDPVRAHQGRLYLPNAPVQDVESATRVSDGRQYVTADLTVNKRRGVVTAKQGTLLPGDYDVVYDAGRDPVPESLKRATLIIAGHLWETQQGPTTNRFIGDEGESGFRVSSGHLIPNRAAHLLTPHAPIGVM